MNFDLHLYGETPEELLNVLAHLGHMDSNYHTPSPDERHPAQAPAPQPQSEPVTQPDKPKAQQTPAKQKKAAQKPAAAPAEEPANPTTAEASDSPSQADAAPVTSTSAPESVPAAEPEKDPATLDKIRDLARSLIVAGKRAGAQAAIKATGAASVSKLPPDSYTSVWEELLKLKDEVDANASN